VTPKEFKDLRYELGMSQNEMARLLGVRASRTIRKWEQGDLDIAGSAIILMSFYKLFPNLLELAPTFWKPETFHAEEESAA
jgi:DNA-binding transcriptional regulator YiaG